MFDWIASVIRTLGAPGVGVLMFLENLFPPIPSELVMPLAGFVATRGQVTLASLIVAGTIGSLLGAVLWYRVGRALGATRLRKLAGRHGRWLGIHPSDVDRAQAWFDRHGAAAVLFGRIIPGVRTFISVPAGIAGMPGLAFLVCSAIGTALWTSALAVSGYLLAARYETVADWLDPVSWGVLAVLVAAYAWRVWRFDPSAD